MSIAPPKRMNKRSRRRAKGRSARKLPPPPTAPKAKRTTVEPSESLQGAPKAIGRRPTKRKGGAVPRAIQSLYGQMEEWVAEAFEKMGASELIGKIPWEWNPRLTSTMGQAHYRWVDGKTAPKKMSFSPRLFQRADETDQRETVFHECAHIVDYHKGTYVKGDAHGESWKRLMRRAGISPKRTHSIVPVGYAEVYCSCRTHCVTRKVYKLIKAGKKKRCNKCLEIVSTEKLRNH